MSKASERDLRRLKKAWKEKEKVWKRKAPERRCYRLAERIGEIDCAVGEIRAAAIAKNANGLLMPLYSIGHAAKEVAGELGADAALAKKLSNRGRLLHKAIEKKGLVMGKLTAGEARFFSDEQRALWKYVRKLQDTAAKSCSTMAPGMVPPVEPFQPIPKGFGK